MKMLKCNKVSTDIARIFRFFLFNPLGNVGVKNKGQRDGSVKSRRTRWKGRNLRDRVFYFLPFTCNVDFFTHHGDEGYNPAQ